MSETEYSSKKEEILADYSSKLLELEDLKLHYDKKSKGQNADSQFDCKIKDKLEIEEKQVKSSLE